MQIYSRSHFGEVRSYNRMIKFCQNAVVVVLVTDMQASLLTPSLVATALDAFHNRPALALLVRAPWQMRTQPTRCLLHLNDRRRVFTENGDEEFGEKVN